MKSTLLYLPLLMLGLSFSACSDDDDDDVTLNNVPDRVESAFEAQFPNVNINSVQWEQKGTYYVADWKEINGMRDVESWFSASPQATQIWAMTNTDYGKNIFLVPAEINSELEKTEYNTATIDDIDLYEYPDATRNAYVIEVEPVGQRTDMLLIFDASTYKYIKAIPDPGTDITPATPLR